MTRIWTNAPRRLERIYQTHAFPVYFVTAVTARRQPFLANETVHQALVAYARGNVPHGRAMGRYAIMPDHIHFMVRLHPEARLSDYVRMLKQRITLAIRHPDYTWQPGFFDRLLRTSERTAHAWQYMVDNPMEAGLARTPDDWPYQGEIEPIRF